MNSKVSFGNSLQHGRLHLVEDLENLAALNEHLDYGIIRQLFQGHSLVVDAETGAFISDQDADHLLVGMFDSVIKGRSSI